MLQIRRLGPKIGAEITGVDVKTMDEATFAVTPSWFFSTIFAANST